MDLFIAQNPLDILAAQDDWRWTGTATGTMVILLCHGGVQGHIPVP